MHPRDSLHNFGNDVIRVTEDETFVFAGCGRDKVIIRGDDNTVDLGFGQDTVQGFGDNTVVNGGSGGDRLIGRTGDDSFWGNFGNDVIRTGKGSDYALGGFGNDLTDTGEGLGIHFGGAGADTFVIGREIVGNGAADTVIALDFGNGNDSLRIAPEILDNVASVEGGPVDLVPVLQAFDEAGLGVEEVGRRLADTFDGRRAFREVESFLDRFEANNEGQILVDATTVTTNEGDVIIALGITPEQLTAALA
jgi:hypothetical protein